MKFVIPNYIKEFLAVKNPGLKADSKTKTDNEPAVVALQKQPLVKKPGKTIGWVLDIADPSQLKRINIKDADICPEGVPSAALLKRQGFGKGPRDMAIRMANNGNPDNFNFVDLYDDSIIKSDITSTPHMLYVDLLQPEFRTLIQTNPGIWNKLKVGAYATALIILVIVVALVIIVLLGES